MEYNFIDTEICCFMNPALQENRMDYMQLFLTHRKRNASGDTAGNETEDGQDEKTRKMKIELKERAMAQELTMEVAKK